MSKPGQIRKAELLEKLYEALNQIEAGKVTFPAGGKRKAIARLKGRIAELEDKGVKRPSYRPVSYVPRSERIAA